MLIRAIFAASVLFGLFMYVMAVTASVATRQLHVSNPPCPSVFTGTVDRCALLGR